MTAPRSLPAVVLVTLCFVVSQGHLGYMVHQLRPNILVLQLTFSDSAYWAILQQWGDAGLAAYRAHLPYDFLHIVIYAVFGRVLATRSGLYAEAETRARRRVAWMLPLAACFDLVENGLQLHLLGLPPGTATSVVGWSASCSAIKWALAVAFALVIGVRIARKSARIGLPSQ